MRLLNSNSWWNDYVKELRFVEDAITKARKTALTERVNERGGERSSST